METKQPTQQDRIEQLLIQINMKLGFITGMVLLFSLAAVLKFMFPDAPWW